MIAVRNPYMEKEYCWPDQRVCRMLNDWFGPNTLVSDEMQ